MTTKTKYTVLGALFMGAFVTTSCTVSQKQADAYNNLIGVAGIYLTPEDAAKLTTADLLIQQVVTVEETEVTEVTEDAK